MVMFRFQEPSCSLLSRAICFVVLVSHMVAGTTAFAAHPTKREEIAVLGQPQYQIASLDLSQRWLELVRDGEVEATVSLPVDSSDVFVRYGVRLATRGSITRCEEFVEELDSEGAPTTQCESIRKISETLIEMQEANAQDDSLSIQSVKYEVDGDFAAQLQLVRTLRPLPSPGFSRATSSVPPAYDSSLDSFVTGPHRLELRPLVGTINLSCLTTPWDVFHNISPADIKGHFLLLPTLSDQVNNWRGQIFMQSDCYDLINLVASIRPIGALLVGYNSVGGGASQNHIHCHAWPSPPVPLEDAKIQKDDEPVGGWNCYAVSKVDSIYDFYDVDSGNVEVSYLKYPVFCVQLSASGKNLHLLAQALWVCIQEIGEVPYNIGFLNRPEDACDNDTSFVDVFLFARSKERSDVLPSLKLGISEMMGVFHAQSDAELMTLTSQSSKGVSSPMEQALKDVSFDQGDGLWEKIKANLRSLETHA